MTEQSIASPDTVSDAAEAAEVVPLPLSLPRTDTGPEQPRLRMRQRIARWTAPKAPQHAVLEPLFNVIKQNHPKADLALLERAYRTAEHYHAGQTRKSGDAYITHPLAVTTILAELGMTEPTLCCLLYTSDAADE